MRRKMQGDWFNATQAGEAASGMEIGEEALGVMVPAGGSELEEGIDAMLSAMVIEMWTAFEVLAESIWNAADAARPLLKQALQGKRDIGLRSSLGIRNRYIFTFAVDGSRIATTVNDNRIEALAQVRHLTVHFGGKRTRNSFCVENHCQSLRIFLQMARLTKFNSPVQ